MEAIRFQKVDPIIDFALSDGGFEGDPRGVEAEVFGPDTAVAGKEMLQLGDERIDGLELGMGVPRGRLYTSSFGFEGKRHQLIDEDGIVARIPPKTVVGIYVTRSGKRVAVFDGRLWALAEVEKRQAEPKPKQAGRPKFIPGPNHPWRRYVLSNKKT